MKSTFEIIIKNSFAVFIVAIFLSLLPPFYFFPGSRLFYSHNLSRVLFLFLLVILLISSTTKKQYLIRDALLRIIILLYFISQSISIFSAQNIGSFLEKYQNILFGFIIFFTSLFILDSRKKVYAISIVFVIILVIQFIIQAIIYFFPGFFFTQLRLFFYDKYMETILVEVKRGKFFLDIHNGVAIPLLFYFISVQKNVISKIFLIMAIGLVILFSFLSNFRMLFFVGIFSFITSLFLFYKEGKMHYYAMISACVFLFIGYFISRQFIGFTVLDRFVGTPEKANYANVEDTISRIYLQNKALDFGFSSPFGIGLGNFYDYMPESKNTRLSLTEWRNDILVISSTHPHNIFYQTFAETGFTGLFFLVVMMGYFFIHDMKYLTARDTLFSSLAIIFWSLFIFGLFHQTYYLQYQSFFWVLRGALNNQIYHLKG